MKRINLWAAMAAVMAIGSFVWYGCTKDAEEDLLGTIYGTVTDYATTQPISGVNVTLRPSGETTLTGSDGTFEFNDLKANRYSLSFSKAEYADLNDNYIIELEAGKKVKRDVQMRKQVVSLRITDMLGHELSSLNFGMEESVISKSFNIYNEGTVSVAFQLFYDCRWIDTVIAASTTIPPGLPVAVTVIIDRAKLSSGENRTYLHIISNNGNNELLITAMGSGSPTVNIIEYGDLTASSVSIVGKVDDDGGSAVIDRGFCWATTDNPNLEDNNHMSSGSGLGQFISNITGLTSNTDYFIRAYATNSHGTAYSQPLQITTRTGLPTVWTDNVTGVNGSSATGNGRVYSDGGYSVTDRGFCWSTTGLPSIENANHINAGTGTGYFSCTLTGLSSNTLYYVRAYATNQYGTVYGDQVQFTTQSGTPSVTLNYVTNITVNSAACSGSITSTGGYAIIDKGFCWSTTPYPTNSNEHLSLGESTSFEGALENLQPGTTYYVRAYATNSQGTSYSSQRQFTTNAGLPTVSTATVTETSGISDLGGEVTADGGFAVTAKGICYGANSNPDLSANFTHTTDGSGLGSFSSTISASTSGTIHVRAYATNANGTAYGDDITVNVDYLRLPSFNSGYCTCKVGPTASSTMNWEDANSYSHTVSIYGRTGWRLPSKDELLQMYNDRATIGGFNTGSYWSSTTIGHDDNTYSYYYVNFGNGSVGWHYGALLYVRPVICYSR